MRRIFRAVVDGKIFIAQYLSAPPTPDCRFIKTAEKLRYYSFCDDFGPMNMASVIRFIELLDSEISSYPSHKIVYCMEAGRRAMANAAFLLGSYMILKLNLPAEQVGKERSWLDDTMVEPFRDATFAPADFTLSLLDCWRGLERGKSYGWVGLPSTTPGVWGMIDIDHYEHCDDPDEADLHEVIPGKLVAFKGPKDLGGRLFADDKQGYRHFSPSHYAPILKELGVSCVVRLNEAHYPSKAFTAHGISHHHLEFEDCTTPPTAVVEDFFKIVDNASGSVAVHCKAGLGRTGTLIALYMMRSLGFTAREAMGWLRIMRPGSVIGEQQRFLCQVELVLRSRLPQDVQSRGVRTPPKPLSTEGAGAKHQHRPAEAVPPVPRIEAKALAAQVASGMVRRGVTRACEVRHAAPKPLFPPIIPSR